MAKDISTDIWSFDATGQYEGIANAGESTAPIYSMPIPVDWILYETNGTDTDFNVTLASGGDSIHGTVRVGATNGQVQLAVGKYLQGVYITTLPTSAKVYVKTGGVVN